MKLKYNIFSGEIVRGACPRGNRHSGKTIFGGQRFLIKCAHLTGMCDEPAEIQGTLQVHLHDRQHLGNHRTVVDPSRDKNTVHAKRAERD